MLAQNLQHPLHYRTMRLNRVQPPGPRQRRMIRRWFAEIVAQELAEAQRIGCPPRHAALRIDALEVTQQQHPEVRARRDRGTPRTALVILPANGFDALVELLGI